MSRSGYSDDCDGWALIRWRGAVNSAIKGKRGQAMLRELLAALDAMPEKRLVAESLVDSDGEFCTLGVLGHARGIPIETLDPEDPEAVARAFGVSPAMVKEIVFENDEVNDGYGYTNGVWGPLPRAEEIRWSRMRAWVASQIISKETPHAKP